MNAARKQDEAAKPTRDLTLIVIFMAFGLIVAAMVIDRRSDLTIKHDKTEIHMGPAQPSKP